MNPVTKEQIVFALQLGGIEKGDVVLMHSALSSIGYVEGGAETVVDAVLEAVGPEGTYAVSTMNGTHPFDPENAPSTVGIISEKHRLRPNSIRSLRPVHSINAIGARAEELTKDHDKCATNCGEGSPYLKLRDMGGKIILLGVDMNRNTTLHAIEDLMDSVYLIEREVPAPMYTPELRRAGALIETRVGDAVAKIIDVKKMFELGQKLLQEKPLFFLCENANCPFCSNAQRLQGERDAAKNG